MNREYRPSRSVARYDDRCSACGGIIKKNTCVARLFNYSAHGRTECEASIIERYASATEAAHGKRSVQV